MKSEYKRVIVQASNEALARYILKNLDWTGGNDDNNGAFLTSIISELRRESNSTGYVPREEIIEECAKVCENMPLKWLEGGGMYGVPTVLPTHPEDCAKAIRSLKGSGISGSRT